MEMGVGTDRCNKYVVSYGGGWGKEKQGGEGW